MKRLTTGIGELDLVLGGGIPSGSLLVVSGAPGTGKTILAHQICFANATEQRKALYYTTLSEPHSKLIRFLDSFDFYDPEAIGRALDIVHLPIPDRGAGIVALADEIARRAFDTKPALVVIDSSKTLHDFAEPEEVRRVVYDLASKLGHTDAVLMLVGEYTREDAERLPEFAVADAIVHLSNELHDAFDERSLRVLKMRGSAYLGGNHSMRIGDAGIDVFARLEALVSPSAAPSSGRVSTGVAALDGMLGGGLPGGTATLIAGPSGAGKTLLALHFVDEGVRNGERCHYVSFRESREQLLQKAAAFGFDLPAAAESGVLTVDHPRPVELVLDEVAAQLRASLVKGPPIRVVIDSLGEIEQATRGPRRFQDYLWSLVELTTSAGATSLLTTETPAFFGAAFELVRGMTFATENLIMLQYREHDLHIGRRLGVVMMRDSGHAKDPLEYDIGPQGLILPAS